MSKIVRIRPPGDSLPQQQDYEARNASADFIGYYKNNLAGQKFITPSGKAPFKGRLLPCYDLSLDTVDEAFKTGVSPYRIDDWRDSATGTLAFSEFAVNMTCYTYLGRSQNRLISPSSRAQWSHENAAEDIADPFVDMINTVSNANNPVWQAIVTRKDDVTGPLLPAAVVRTFYNMWGMRLGERAPYNAVVDTSSGAFLDLRNQLNYEATPDAPGRDPNWSQYLLGDVTDPAHGLVTLVGLITIPAQRKKLNGFTFQLDGGDRNTLSGIAERAVGADVLAGRSLLLSEESVFKILSYQELVDFAIADGAFPLELIKQACGHMANVSGKDNSKAAFVSPPPAQRVPAITPTPAQDFVFDQPAVPAPPAPSAPVAPSVPVAPPVEEPKFYYITDANPTTPVFDTKSSIQLKLDAGLRVQVHSDGNWLSDYALATLGFTVRPTAATPLPPPPAAPAPSVGMVKTVSADYIPVGVAAPIAAEHEPKTIAADVAVSSIPEDDMAWYKDTAAKFLNNTLSPDEIVRWVDLDTRIRAANA